METKKLTCCDIMVGDWVMAKKEPIRIATPFGNETVLHQLTIYGYTSDGAKAGPFLETELSPIPLTAEILEKNGFTRLGTKYILEGEHFALDNPSNPNNYLDNYWLRISINAVNIEYVHELQRALRFLKIDKNIAL